MDFCLSQHYNAWTTSKSSTRIWKAVSTSQPLCDHFMCLVLIAQEQTAGSRTTAAIIRQFPTCPTITGHSAGSTIRNPLACDRHRKGCSTPHLSTRRQAVPIPHPGVDDGRGQDKVSAQPAPQYLFRFFLRISCTINFKRSTRSMPMPARDAALGGVRRTEGAFILAGWFKGAGSPLGARIRHREKKGKGGWSC